MANVTEGGQCLEGFEVTFAEQATCVVVGLGLVLCFAVLSFGSAETRARYLGGDGQLMFERLQASHVSLSSRGCSPMAMAGLRLSMAGYIFFTLTRMRSVELFGTFTIWSWVLLGFYFGITGFLSLQKACRGADAESSNNRATSLHRFLWVMFQVMVVVALFIDLIVWLVLIPLEYTFSGWDKMVALYFNLTSVSAHNINFVFLVIETYLNRMTVLRAHAPFIVLYGSMYIVFSWFQFWIWSRFWYIFLDWCILGLIIVPCYFALAGALYGAFIAISKCAVRLKKGVDPELLPTEEGILASQELAEAEAS